jgi:hypothetical protein
MVDAVPRLGAPAGHLYRNRSHGLLPPLLDLSVGQACSGMELGPIGGNVEHGMASGDQAQKSSTRNLPPTSKLCSVRLLSLAIKYSSA